jgi:hypothetical protein
LGRLTWVLLRGLRYGYDFARTGERLPSAPGSLSIYGEVCLWGTVVEHERGWRAQLAYPKNLFLSPDALPFTLAEIWPRLQALTLYGSDIFVLDNDQTSSLWGKRSGFDPAGLDYLIARSKGYYDRSQRDRTLRKGDRVAVLGRGIAVVEHIDSKWIFAAVWNKCELRIARREIVWDERNMRWETDANSAFECLMRPIQ